jgi:hypothetical protein
MSDEFTCDGCRKRVIPEFLIIDDGVCHPLITATAIKRCPDCGAVLAGL